MKKKYLKFILYLFSVLYIAPGGLHAQDAQVTIKGKIVDEVTGEAIIGSTVSVKGSKDAVQTDADGAFELKTKKVLPFTLYITYVGYQNKEIEVFEEDEPLDVKLRSVKALSEVVVVGYGEQKRSDFTGSIATVPEELKAQPVSGLDRLLQGSVAGVQVTQTSGQPGAGTSIQIRGNSSVNAGSQPLYVIDGFPIYNDQSTNNAGNSSGSNISPLSSINTNDIQSIDVLKDASATAIYGSRGANGVVLVTTKKGTPGKATINYDAYVGVQDVTHKIALLDNTQWLALRRQAYANAGATDPIINSTGGLQKYGIDTNTNTNWQDAILQKGLIQSHNISILSGSDNTRIAFSGNYFNQQGVIKNTGFTRYSGRLNIEHDYSDKFKISSYILASNTNANIAPYGVVQATLQMPPILPIYNPNGSFVLSNILTSSTNFGNPVNSLLNQINNSNTNTLLGNVSGEYKIIPGLTAKVSLGTNIVDNKQNTYIPASTYEGSALGGVAQVGSVFTTNWLNENTLNYSKKFNKKHSLNAVLGYTQQASATNGAIAGASNFPNDILTYNALQTGTNTTITGAGGGPNSGSIPASSPSSIQSQWALQSYLARVNYNYNDRFLFTATVREDGSSRFAKKWGTFPSAAAAWNVHNESFFKGLGLDKTLSQLKIRASAGLTGNQQIPPYSSLAQLGYYRYNFNGTTVSGYAPNTIANPNLTWEKTAQYDIGIDVGILKNRITLVADVYLKKTSDLLLLVTLPSQAGILNFSTLQDQEYENLGAMQNKGLELAVNSQNLVGKFKWNSSLVFSMNRNEVTSLGGPSQLIPNSALPSVLQVGQPIGSFLVYETNGLVAPNTPYAQVLSPSPVKSPTNPAVGLAGQQQYLDVNHDGTVTQAGDRVVIPNQPKFIAGFTNTFSYKGFDLVVFFQTSYGNKIFNQNASLLGLNNGQVNGLAADANFYSPTNTNTNIPAPNANSVAATLSNYYIEDGSYLRLKNITFGYTFPNDWVKKARFKNIRVYVSAQNWLTWTKYTGFDPEVTSNDQSAVNQGVDYGAYPNTKSVQGGVSVSF